MPVTGRTKVARWGGVLLVALAPLPWVGLGTASAGAGSAVYATVDGYEAFSSDANHPDYWGDDCHNIAGGSFSSYVLDQDYDKVIVKAGAGEFANTIFNDAAEGETVWADTNGDGVFNPGGPGGDKQISHIIVCAPKTTPTPTETTETPTPTETETTETATPTDTESSAAPTVTETGSSEPGTSVKPTRLTQPATLPQTGSGVPVAGALAASLLLIGLGALLLMGPGRLAPERYSRKH